MICKNCGAHFEDNLPKCPYCGEFHYAGAQKEYMGKLEDLKEGLDDLHETIPEMYANELKSQAKKVRKIVLIIGGILAALVLFFLISTFAFDSIGSRDEKEVLLFTKEAFPIADEYYEAGDYDGLLRFYHTSMEENENADFYKWEHYSFLMCYENLCIFRESADKLNSDDFSDFDMHELFYCYISNRYYQKGYPMDEADQLLASGFEDEMESVIDSIHLTEDEQKTFNDFLNANEYPSWEEIEDFSKKIYKRLY